MSGIFRYNSNITPTRRTALNSFCATGQDATMDSSYALGLRSPTSFNMLAGHPGNTSPGQGRSLRDYDEKLHALTKENFHLKLRLFFLEEKTPTTAGASKSEDDNLFKQNIDLKVENEELRKELQEKQDILCEAAKAMELMGDSQKNSNDSNSATVIELRRQIEVLEEQIRAMESSSTHSVSSGVFGRPMSSTDTASRSLPIDPSSGRMEEMTLRIKDLEKLISQRDKTIKSLEVTVETLKTETANTLEVTMKTRAANDDALLLTPVDGDLDDVDAKTLQHKLAAQTHMMVERENTIEDLKEQLEATTTARDRGLKTIQYLMKKTHDMNEDIEKFKSKEQKLQNNSGTLNASAALNSSANINSLKADLVRAKAEADQAIAWRKECADVCAVLTIRLQELAGFLDSLLKHKDVLSVLAQDRHRAMRKAVDRSLDLSRSLNNMSISGGTGRFSLDEKSLMQFSTVSELLNNSYFNASFMAESREQVDTGGVKMTSNFVIENLRAENKQLKEELDRLSAESALSSGLVSGVENLNISVKERSVKNTSLRTEANSESEAWSEPDRKVSHERIGLDDSVKLNTHVRSFNGKYDASSSGSDQANNSQLSRKNSVLRLQEKIASLEAELSVSVQENESLKRTLADAEMSLAAEKSTSKTIEAEIEAIRQLYDQVVAEKDKLQTCNSQLESELDEQVVKCKELFSKCETKIHEIKELRESFETEVNDIREQHAAQLDAMISQENVKLELLRQQLADKFNKQLEEAEREHALSLQMDWVARVVHEEKLQQLQEVETRLGESQTLLKLMRENEDEIKAQLQEKECSLKTAKRSLDEATLQTSKAVLERTKVMNDRDQLDQQLRELQDKYDNIVLEKSELHARNASYASKTQDLQYKLSRSASQGNARYTINTSQHGISSSGEHSGYTSDELKQRLDNSSPDLGIESDATARSSGTDANNDKLFSRTNFKASSTSILLEGDEEDVSSQSMVPQKSASHAGISYIVQHDCQQVEKENTQLRQKLEKTRRAFEKTWNQLRISNQRKEQIEKDIRQEIYKTHSVLKNVRSNMESVGQQQREQKSPQANRSSDGNNA